MGLTPDKPAKQVKAATSTRKEVGDSGVFITSGFITGEEYNKDLVGRSAYDKYDEMRRSDATIKAALSAVILPILSARWSVDPAEAEPGSADAETNKLVADRIEHCLLKKLNWNQTLSEILTMLPFGFSVFEEVWGLTEYEGEYYIGLDKLASRKQKTIVAWKMENGEPGVQQLKTDGTTANIPDSKLAIFTNQKEGDNYEGISLLRAAYKPWYMKSNLEKIDAMVHERQGLGILVLRTPFGASDEDLQKARTIAKNTRANEQSYVELPQGFEMEFMEMKSKTSQRDVLPSLAYHQREIMKSVLAQFLELGGQESSGSYSTSADHSKLFLLSVESIAKNVASVINESVIKRMVMLNGWEVTDYPKLTFDKIGEQDIEKLALAVSRLMQMFALTPTAKTEEWLRDLLNAPGLEEEISDNYGSRVLPSKNAPGSNGLNESTPEDEKEKDELQKTADDDLIDKAVEYRRSLRSVLGGGREPFRSTK